MATLININIVYNVVDKEQTYLDIVHNELEYYYKSWFCSESELLEKYNDPFTSNDTGVTYKETISNMGDPCITLIKYEE